MSTEKAAAATEAAPVAPAFPAGNTARYLMDTSTCVVWDTSTGTAVRREWSRSRGLPRLVFAAEHRPQLGEAIKAGLERAGVKVRIEGKPERWPSVHRSTVAHNSPSFALGALSAVPRGRPANAAPPTYAAWLGECNGEGFKLPAFIPIAVGE